MHTGFSLGRKASFVFPNDLMGQLQAWGRSRHYFRVLLECLSLCLTAVARVDYSTALAAVAVEGGSCESSINGGGIRDAIAPVDL